MASKINGSPRMIVKSRVVEMAEENDVESAWDGEYADLMQNIEGQVQTILEEEGILGF